MKSLSMQKKAQRLRIYIGESDRWRGKPLFVALLELLKKQGMAGASVFRGVAGFGARSRIHTAAVLRLSEDLPLVIDVVDTPEKVQMAVELVYPMVSEGLMTVEDVQVVKYTHRYLNPIPADRLVSAVMTREVVTLPLDLPVFSAWERMLKTMVKGMPVIKPDRTVVGIVTDEDLLERAGIRQRLSVAARLPGNLVQEEINLLKESPLLVQDVMSHPVITIHATDSLGSAAALMAHRGLKRLPVVDEQQRLVGVLSRLDVLRQVAELANEPVLAKAAAAAGQTVGEVMSEHVPTVKETDSLPRVVETMLSDETRKVVVTDDAGRAVGLISDSDVVARVAPQQQRGILQAFQHREVTDISTVTAKQLMSEGMLTTKPSTSLLDADRLMLTDGRKWLVVVDEAGKSLGLVDRQILLRAMANYYDADNAESGS